MAEPQKPFRVIIVGGGLVSLTAAHILSKADIDFVILEKHDNLTPQIGSLLNVWPPAFRVFDQVGLLDAVQPISNRINRGVNMSAEDGTIFSELDPDDIQENNHGYGVRVTHRPLLIDTLYQRLPDHAKARIKLSKHVVNVIPADDEVSVECADGTVVSGSIVIGADGVHSRVRECMQAMADGRPPPDKTSQPKSPYVTTYRMLIANVPIPPGVGKNTNYEGLSERVSTQILTGDDRAWFGIYEALDKPTSERIKYTEEDKEKFIERWGHLYTAPGWKARDVYALRKGDAGIINLEEGLIDRWTHRRIVLVGDAVRKLEPHAGLGYNSGVVDVVVLANKLRRLLQAGPSPSEEDLEKIFEEYQKERLEDMPAIVSMSMRRARMTAWLTPWNKIMAKYIAPWINLGKYSLLYIYGPIVAREPILEWLEEKNYPPTVQIPYLYYSDLDEKHRKPPKYEVTNGLDSLSIYTGALTLAAFAAVVFRYYRRV
ncbi:hypothetical protein AAE478_004144 [Parahypoxylon ruwenzoriense]